jgi:hypothetical protein
MVDGPGGDEEVRLGEGSTLTLGLTVMVLCSSIIFTCMYYEMYLVE